MGRDKVGIAWLHCKDSVLKIHRSYMVHESGGETSGYKTADLDGREAWVAIRATGNQ